MERKTRSDDPVVVARRRGTGGGSPGNRARSGPDHGLASCSLEAHYLHRNGCCPGKFLERCMVDTNVSVRCADGSAMPFPERTFSSAVCFTFLVIWLPRPCRTGSLQRCSALSGRVASLPEQTAPNRG